jgi:serine/threonine protein kinase
MFPSCPVNMKRNRQREIVLVQMLLHMTERVQMLHEQGIVHRDLKPGNILWRPSVHSWTLIDFGCAAEIGAHPLHARPYPLLITLNCSNGEYIKISNFLTLNALWSHLLCGAFARIIVSHKKCNCHVELNQLQSIINEPIA